MFMFSFQWLQDLVILLGFRLSLGWGFAGTPKQCLSSGFSCFKI